MCEKFLSLYGRASSICIIIITGDIFVEFTEVLVCTWEHPVPPLSLPATNPLPSLLPQLTATTTRYSFCTALSLKLFTISSPSWLHQVIALLQEWSHFFKSDHTTPHSSRVIALIQVWLHFFKCDYSNCYQTHECPGDERQPSEQCVWEWNSIVLTHTGVYVHVFLLCICVSSAEHRWQDRDNPTQRWGLHIGG